MGKQLLSHRADKASSPNNPSLVPHQPMPEINLANLTPEAILRLQATHGNHFVQRLLATSQPCIQRVEEVKDLSTPASDNAPLVIHHVNTKQEGQSILARLADGDRTPLTAMNLVHADDYNTQSHEWGLGFDKDVNRYAIVRGGPSAVKWSVFGGRVDGLEHTHPTATAQQAVDPYQGIPDLNGLYSNNPATVLATATANTIQLGTLPNREIIAILPSNSDIIASYVARATVEEYIHAAYKLHNNTFSQQQGEPIISSYGPSKVELHTNLANKTKEQQVIRAVWAPVTIKAGQQTIWTGFVNADFVNKTMAVLSSEGPKNQVYTRQEIEAMGYELKQFS